MSDVTQHKIAFVVPTKDREKDLRKMLCSLEWQTRKPDQIIVVDGSDPVITHVVNEFPKLQIDYVREFPPSLSRQRNAGMSKLRPEITLAGYLDDDLVLERDAIEKMCDFWSKASEIYGGAAFAITNAPRTPYIKLMTLMGLDHSKPGTVLETGWVSPFGCPMDDIDVEWLCGGATVWHRDVVDSFGYDEWFQGTGFLEDVDFSYRVGEKWRLAVVSSAKVAHYHHPIRVDRYQLLGQWQIVNRMYLVRKHQHRGLSLTKAWWAGLSLIILNISLSLLHRNLNGIRCAWGNVLGMVMEIMGKHELSGHLK